MPILTMSAREATGPVAGYLADAAAVRVVGRFALADGSGEPLLVECEITARGVLPLRLVQWPDGRVRVGIYRAAGAPVTVAARVRAGIPAGRKLQVNRAIALAVMEHWEAATGRRKLFECEFSAREMSAAGEQALLAALRGDLTPLGGAGTPRGAQMTVNDLEGMGVVEIPAAGGEALPAPLAALYLDSSGAARPEEWFERVARLAVAATVQPGEENDYRRLPMRPGQTRSDALWRRMRAAGAALLAEAVPPAFRGEEKLAPLRTDLLAVEWWSRAMARLARAAERVRDGVATADLLEAELAAAAGEAPDQLPAGWAEAAIRLAGGAAASEKKSSPRAELCQKRFVYATYEQRPGRPSFRAPHASA